MVGPSSIDNWIFVTGMIRSGTTFLGSVLSHPLTVDYIHEPFNGGYTLPEGIALRPRYVRPGDVSPAADRFRTHVAKIFSYDIGMRSARYDDDPLGRALAKKIVGSRGPFHLRLAKVNPFHRAALIKDPMAGLSTGFLNREFGVRPVVIVRHPVSLAASLRRLGWFPELYDFQLQPDLIEDFLQEENDIFDRTWANRLLEAMAHWRLLHRVLLEQASRHGGWIVITHEELSAEPVTVFRRLYRDLDLPWSASVAAKIKSLTQQNGKVHAQNGRVQDFQRDSARIFEARRDAIPVDLRRKIFEITADVACDLYSRKSFALDE
jgi:hypothetical protein